VLRCRMAAPHCPRRCASNPNQERDQRNPHAEASDGPPRGRRCRSLSTVHIVVIGNLAVPLE
jgi:hypothetical protein